MTARHSTWWIVRLFVVSRVAATVLVTLARPHARPDSLAQSGGGIGPKWFTPWTFFDGGHYVEVARDGYSSLRTVYSPLYPILLRLGGSDSTRIAVVGLVVSLACFASALPVLYRLVAREHGERVAKHTLIVIAFLPCASLWGAVYTESLALLLLVLTWNFVRSGSWGRAIVPAALCGLTRNFGLVVTMALLVELIQQTREQRQLRANQPVRQLSRSQWLARVVVCGAPALTSAGYLLWVREHFGASAGIMAQKAFERDFAWPWWPIVEDVRNLGNFFTFGEFFSLLAIGLSIVFAIRYRNIMRWGSSVLVLGVLAMHLVMARQHLPHTIGAARYVMPTFPFSMALGLASTRASKFERLSLLLILLTFFVMGSVAFGMSTFDHG